MIFFWALVSFECLSSSAGVWSFEDLLVYLFIDGLLEF